MKSDFRSATFQYPSQGGFRPTPPHKCQIDCTNHDQVISNLQSKSKDLYHFWRNYEWLYQRYYNSLEQNADNSEGIRSQQDHIHQLQIQLQNERRRSLKIQQQSNYLVQQLNSDNEKLKMRLNQLSAAMANSRNPPPNPSSSSLNQVQEDYKREIARLKNNAKHFQEVIESLQAQLSAIQKKMAEISQEYNNEKQKNSKYKNQFNNQRMQLQATIQQLRRKIAENIHQHQNYQSSMAKNKMNEMMYKHSTAVNQKVSQVYRQVYAQAKRIVEDEMQQLRREMKENMMRRLISEQLGTFNWSQLIVNVDERRHIGHLQSNQNSQRQRRL